MNNEEFLMDIELRANAVPFSTVLTFEVESLNRFRGLLDWGAVEIPLYTTTMRASTALTLVRMARQEITERVAKTLSTNLGI